MVETWENLIRYDINGGDDCASCPALNECREGKRRVCPWEEVHENAKIEEVYPFSRGRTAQ